MVNDSIGMFVRTKGLKNYIEDLCKGVVNDKWVYESRKRDVKAIFKECMAQTSSLNLRALSRWIDCLEQDYVQWYWRDHDLAMLCAVLGEEYEEIYMRICGEKKDEQKENSNNN